MVDETTQVLDELTDRIMARLIAQDLLKTPKRKKKYRSWEREFAYEYMDKFYKEYPKWFKIEVGKLPPGKENVIYTKVRRWADCILLDNDHIVIFEFKMIAKPGVVSQILLYKDLFKETPEFRRYHEWPVKLKIVCAKIDEHTERLAKEHGIEVEVYRPSFYDEWIKETVIERYGIKEAE